MTNSKPVIDSKAVRRYKRLAFWTILTLYVLIMVGGIVRATGAGMGCPDWPRCFGRWVPPTDISQLPSGYKEIYGAKLKGEIEFNPVKTWIEYVNRLFGVFTGMWIFATLLASVPFLRLGQKSVFYLSLAAFLLVGFQGWLGAKVVSSELHPVMITLHMLLAIVIVFILLYAYAKVSYVRESIPVWKKDVRSKINGLVFGVILLSVIQVMLGTQVREAMDEVVMRLGYAARSEWIANLGVVFLIHRSFSLVLLAANIGLWRVLNERARGYPVIEGLTKWMLGILLLEVITGVVLNYLAVPAVAQPVHLTLAIVLLGIQFVLALFLNADKVFKRSAGNVSNLVVNQ